MKFTLSWLKDHLETDASVEEIADKLTAIGLEIEGIENPAEALKPFKVAKVISAAQHPDADKLRVLSVDAGDGPMQVVCGAPNAREGMLGVFGGPGTYVPGADFTLGEAKIRGVESFGMMCSARELQVGEGHDGIIELPEDAPVGTSYADYANLDDPVFDVFVTPNRQDCMGVRGIARDLAAAGLGTLKPDEAPVIEGTFEPTLGVHLDDEEGCPALFGRQFRGLKNPASPDWMQRRLKAIGQRPISALVDITNYAMFDLGRPSHAYDMAKLKGDLIVRRAANGEIFHALNEKEYPLDGTMTVIADDEGVHDLGGIMGGLRTGVSDDTTEAFLEIAYFEPDRIARTGQKTTLTSDARSRFERGVDPAFLEDGEAIITKMILDICGGEVSTPIRAGEPPVDNRVITYDYGRAASLGGVEVEEARQAAILESLGFTVDGNKVTVPSWRRDVEGSADLVEEVVRIVGMDEIPSTALPREEGVAHPVATRAQVAERKLRRAAAARGLHEAVTWSFISEDQAKPFGGGAHMLANPISEDMKVMRPSLLPGLAAAARRNLDRGASSIRLFEVGRRYLAEGEKRTATLLLVGEKRPRGWMRGKAEAFTAYDAKDEAIALLDAAGAPTANLTLFAGAGDDWHPGRSAALGLGPKKILARFGELHPALAVELDLPSQPVAAELYLDAIPEPRSNDRARVAYSPPALMAVKRDFAFIVPDELSANQLERAVAGADKKHIVDTHIFDRFEGKDGLSLAIEVTLQPGEKSFTEEELGAISQKIMAAAEAKGASLRA
ncbi:phenylalanine--tRNA ligase subunit beta [Sphingomicrobium sediminis]|uniref:Phenylalanine--tRNA ligase beta subunit n=1 Tax=Sphingomicrobium sediminis TaxID=2950949 RepID=A0A9X2EMH4_9SPHN|nr:phenylalanine--tRNA ligase subunit beta [Sphingomicrobium sediminis]MCM8558104.1 phenylalanine--tRNA ligase subunit beta [Sphingomicrobium sediminis]